MGSSGFPGLSGPGGASGFGLRAGAGAQALPAGAATFGAASTLEGTGTLISDGLWKTMSTCLLGGTLRRHASAGMSSSRPTRTTWITKLVSMLRVDGAPDVLNMFLPASMVVTKRPP